jgi:CubicO group peptidase (beta-lactamase class C family)
MQMHARTPDGSLAPIPFGLPDDPEFLMGGGGLYGTVADYLRFQQTFLRSGRTESGEQLVSNDSFEALLSNQINDLSVTPMRSGLPTLTNPVDLLPDVETKWSLGFLVNTTATRTGRSAGSLAWAGLGNSYFWIDPHMELTGILVTQTAPFGDPAIIELFTSVEAAAYRDWN